MIFHKDLQDAMDVLKDGPSGKKDATQIIQRIKSHVQKEEHASKTLFRKIIFDADAFVNTLDKAYAGLLDNPDNLTLTEIRRILADTKAREEAIVKDIKKMGSVLSDMKRI